MRARLLFVAPLLLLLALLPLSTAAATDPPVPPPPTSPTEPCDSLSPIAIPCTAVGKLTDAISAECRRVGLLGDLCLLPLAHRVTAAAVDAYQDSWVHRTAAFQSALGDTLPFSQAQWIGTHNSFNSLSGQLSLSHADSNQQLSLTQQLDVDVRSIELDLHYVKYLGLLGKKAVTVCHGQGPELADLGCTWEPPFAQVLPEIGAWLNDSAHADQVLMLYLEDNLGGDQAAYDSAVATIDKVLRRPDGSSLVYRPDPAGKAANGCVPLPLDLTRNQVRASGARVVIVGKCAPGWSGRVFDWNPVHVESGSTSGYQAWPECDASYGREVYVDTLVRYFEDTTLVSNLLDLTRPPANPEALTPAKVQAMTNCGVNLFGLDQLLPEDGRIQATLWSWAPDEPRAGAGTCTLQGADSRWVAAQCAEPHPAACVSGDTWSVTAPVAFADAASACAASGAEFGLPRAGDENSALHAVAGDAGAWVDYRFG